MTPSIATKAISPARDRLQSRLLVAIAAPLLCALVIRDIALSWMSADQDSHHYLVVAIAISLGFALLTWTIKAATPLAAACGGLICLLLILHVSAVPPSLLHSALPPLVLLFLLTFAATRYGRSRKEARGLAEARTGRRASQVIANLGVAGLCAGLSHPLLTTGATLAAAATVAALAEATADTLSSEIGQAIGDNPFLLTNLRPAPVGTDGAITLAGTIAGLLGAAAVVLIALPAFAPDLRIFVFVQLFLAAAAGLFFDSLLGATVERKGWLGNDLVNFTSTAFAALLAALILHSTGQV